MRWWSAGGAAKMAAFPVNAARSARGPYRGAAKMAALHTAAQERGPPARSRNGRDARCPS